MSSPAGNEHGKVSNLALICPDVEDAGQFYEKLFGWRTVELDLGEKYIQLLSGDNTVGVISSPSRGAPQDIPGWVLLFYVDNIDKAVRRLESFGGSVLTHPFATADGGTVSVVKAPGGEIFCLRWVPPNSGGTHTTMLPWIEVVTREPDLARECYAKLFGWTFEEQKWEHGTYTSIRRGDARIGGLVQYTDSFGDLAFEAALRGRPTVEKDAIIPHWMVFFPVENLDSTLTRASELGAVYRGRAHQIPDVGRFAMIRDENQVFFCAVERGRASVGPPASDGTVV